MPRKSTLDALLTPLGLSGLGLAVAIYAGYVVPASLASLALATEQADLYERAKTCQPLPDIRARQQCIGRMAQAGAR